DDRSRQRKEREHRIGDSRGFLFFAASQQVRIDGNERCRKRAFAEDVLEKVGDAESGAEGAGRVGKAQVVSEHPLANDADDSTNQNAGADHERVSTGALAFVAIADAWEAPG